MTVTDADGHISIYDTYVPGQPNSHREETCTACISEKVCVKEDVRRRNGSLLESELPAIPPIDSKIENIFASIDMGLDNNGDDNGMDSSSSSDDDDCNSEEVIDKPCSGIEDILLTGEVRASTSHNVLFIDRKALFTDRPRARASMESLHLLRSRSSLGWLDRPRASSCTFVSALRYPSNN